MKLPPGAENGPAGAIIVTTASRPLRRRLRPLAWVALEEVALDAVAEEGRLVARTSARQVAQLLGVDPGPRRVHCGRCAGTACSCWSGRRARPGGLAYRFMCWAEWTA